MPFQQPVDPVTGLSKQNHRHGCNRRSPRTFTRLDQVEINMAVAGPVNAAYLALHPHIVGHGLLNNRTNERAEFSNRQSPLIHPADRTPPK